MGTRREQKVLDYVKRKVLDYMVAEKIPILIEGNVVILRDDDSCEMARVDVNGVMIMEGNYWDFHNGCHGMDDIPEFTTAEELADLFADALDVTVTTDDTWTYE